LLAFLPIHSEIIKKSLERNVNSAAFILREAFIFFLPLFVAVKALAFM
jgi:hypothetical protein